MTKYYLPIIFLIITFGSLVAQNNTVVNIFGPQFLCEGRCDSLRVLVSEVNNFPPPYLYVVTTPSNDTTFEVPFQVCGDQPGQYTVVVYSGNGSSATATFNLFVLPYQPLKIISSNTAPCNNVDSSAFFCEKVCPNSVVTYTVQTFAPGGDPIPLGWQVNGASSFQVNNPPYNSSVTVTWGAAGTGSVSVFSNGVGGPTSGGCGGEDAICVDIVAEPRAQFTTNPAPNTGLVTICKGQTVYFDNQSTGADHYEWAFNDDFSTAYEAEPQHIFQTAGTYTVQLIARSSCLCADTSTLSVEVLDAVSPTLDCVGTICPNETVTYTAANGCAPYAWSVTPNGTILNGGTSNSDSITVQWLNGPTGTITLGAAACNGALCPQPAVIQVPVIDDNAEIKGKARVCPASEESYSIESYSGTSFVWTLSGGGTIQDGQGTNHVIVAWTEYPNPNTTYWLSVKYDNCYLGCGGQDSIAVNILSPFIINGPVEACAGASVFFNARLTTPVVNLLVDWTLNNPDGSVAWTSAAASANVSIPFGNQDGLYQLFALPADPSKTCLDEATWAINIAALPDLPTGISGTTIICPNTDYTYKALSNGTNNNFRWTVQNGPGAPVTNTGNPLNVTWGATGPYQLAVRQVSIDGLGCLSDTVHLDVQAISLPSITGDNLVCEDATGQYAIDVEEVDIQWTTNPVGAGAIANGQGTKAVEIFWTQAGNHTISANICGQIATFPVAVQANPVPMVQAPASVCAGQTKPVQTVISYANYAWQSEDGTLIATSPIANLGGGSYSVQVTDNQGCIGLSDFTILTDPNPNVNITTADFTAFCNNSNFVTITALTNSDGNFQYQWFQDGTPVGGNTATYTTNQYGLYTATVTNQYGCTASDGPVAIIEYCGGGVPGIPLSFCPAGSVDLTITPTALCDSFSFQISGAQYQPGTATWRWGESGAALLGTSNLDNPSFTFQNAGNYLAIVSAQLQNGSTCLIVDSLKVLASAQFSVEPACPGSMTTFKEESTFLPGSGISSWAWSFGDPASGANNTSAVRAANHTYSASGNYPTILTITANSGCTSSTTRAAIIPILPIPAFTLPTQNCAGNALAFNTINPAIANVTWDFGQPATGSANDATGKLVYHSFTPAGTYLVTSTATNAFGCTGVFSQNVTVTPNILSGTITPANPAPICEGSSVTLTAPAGGISWIWSDSTTTTPTLTTSEEGTYRVTITDSNGCTYIPAPVKVEVKSQPNALVKALLENDLGQIIGTPYPTLTVCAGEDVHLKAQSNGSFYGYGWSDGNSSDDEVLFTEDRNNLLTVGTHTFTVTVTDYSSGCTAVTEPFIVTVNPVPSGFQITANSNCAQAATTLTYQGPMPGNWQFIWNNGQTGATLSAVQPGLHFVRVINEFGCEAKSNSLYIQPGPPISAIPGGCHTRCRPDTLCLPLNLPNVASWQWYYNGNPIAGATGPDLIAEESGSYWAVLTDSYGCEGQSDPLNLQLFDAYGNVTGQVWSDVNNNGIIDATDTLISGIPVNLYQNGQPVAYGQSNIIGTYAFANILATNYVVQIDAASLPSQWQVVIGQNPADMSGCQTLATADLLLKSVCPVVTAQLQLSACPGASATYQGNILAIGTSQDFTYTTTQGCDSILTVTVQSFPTATSALTLSACPGSTVTYNGAQLAAGTVQDFAFQSYLGCDSTVTVTVQEASVSLSSLNLATCFGSTVSYNGTQLAPGTTQNFVFQNSFGCDSTVIVTVQTLPVSTSAITLTTCPGSTVSYNGSQLAPGTVQNFVFQNYFGCDSTVTVNVQALQNAGSLLEVSICPEEVFNYDSITTIAAGEIREFHLLTAEGCDSIVTVVVMAFPTASFTLVPVNSCATQPTGSLVANQISGVWPYQFSLNGGAFQTDSLFQTLAAGNYQVILEDGNGCSTSQNTSISELPRLELLLTDAFLPCDSSGVQLRPVISGDTTALHYRWWNGSTAMTTTASEAGPIWLEATNQCETVRREATARWTETATDSSYVYFPNVFAPEGKMVENTVFRPAFATGLTPLQYHLEIFDRWGNLMFQSDQAELGWEGKFQRRTMIPGVYVWHLRAELAFCGRMLSISKHGDVTIVR